jgi:hypothetical protein
MLDAMMLPMHDQLACLLVFAEMKSCVLRLRHPRNQGGRKIKHDGIYRG